MVGIAFDDGPTRAGRYEEAAGIIRALHTTGSLTHQGVHYRLQDCELLVEPVQRPIPLLLGGGGPRMTRFAARQGDIIGFVPRSLPGGGLDPAEFSAAAFDEKIAVLDAAVEELSDGGPERAILTFSIGRSINDLPRDPDNSWTTPEVLADGPYSLIGDTEQVIDTMVERRARWGLSYITCWEEDIDVMAPVVARLVGT